MHRGFEFSAVVTLLGCLVACGDARVDSGQAPSPAAWSIERARVLFSARRGETRDLFVLDRGSGEVSRLTHYGEEGAVANNPRVSPDGRRIAFQVIRGSNYEIYSRILDGGDATNLTAHPDYDISPVWSPDGGSIGFMSTRGFEPGSIGPFPGHVYSMPAAGGSPRRITGEPLTSALGPGDWSPDGRWMTIARERDGRPDLYLLDQATGAETRLTETAAREYSATFSNDGRRLAFHSETENESQIEVMNLDGSGRRPITSGPGFRYSPRWSPDDGWILFAASDDGGQYDLLAVRVSDGHVIELVATDEDEREGTWLPPG